MKKILLYWSMRSRLFIMVGVLFAGVPLLSMDRPGHKKRRLLPPGPPLTHWMVINPVAFTPPAAPPLPENNMLPPLEEGFMSGPQDPTSLTIPLSSTPEEKDDEQPTDL